MTPRSIRSLRIVQVSDCHLPGDAQTPYRGLNADRQLASLLPAIRRWQPDLVLLTGDVSEDGSAPAYGRAAAQLGSTGARILALPGNHDAPALMRRYFPQGPWDGPFSSEHRGWQLVMLDSTIAGEVGGALPAAYLDRLEQCLARSKAPFALLALHHHPLPMGAEWIDRYPLQAPEALLELVSRHPRVRVVCWGHVHQDFRLEQAGVLWLGAPSSVASSLPGTVKFTLDTGGPACRWLELGADGAVETGLIRAASVRAA